MTTALSIALITLGLLSVLASVFSVLGHGITSRSPAKEPFLLFVVGGAAILAGLTLLGR